MTSILAYLWFIECKKHRSSRLDDAAAMEWRACAKIGLIHHVLAAIHESVMVLRQTFKENRQAFPEVPTTSLGVLEARGTPHYLCMRCGHPSTIDA